MQSKFLSLIAKIPFKNVHLKAGALLFERADPVDNIYAVEKGEVLLLRHQLDGAAFILQRASPGALIAEASLMSTDYHCAAEAATDCQLRSWPRTRIQSLIYQEKEVALAYAAHLAGEVRTARLRAEIASFKRVRDRLDAWLTWHESGLPEKGNWLQLAQEINVTPEALYREIARRRKAGS